jgi:Flp pilus assembly protein TadD
LALKTGQRDAAKAFYFTTLTLQPFHSRAHNNLGVLALEDRNWPEAEKRFITTLKLEPEDAKAFYLLALAQEGAGNFSAARESIAAALRLRPGQRDFLALEERLRAR